MNYKLKEIKRLTGLSHQRLTQLRQAPDSVKRKLIRGLDWDYFDGEIVYFESALKKLKLKVKAGRPKKKKNDTSERN